MISQKGDLKQKTFCKKIIEKDLYSRENLQDVFSTRQTRGILAG